MEMKTCTKMKKILNEELNFDKKIMLTKVIQNLGKNGIVIVMKKCVNIVYI
jgi:hypothetical protein